MVLEVSTSVSGNKAEIKLAGRFDFNEHRIFKSTYDVFLQQAGVTTLDINLAGVEYLDSSALGMLMLLRERAMACGKTVMLSRASSAVAQILDIANFGKLFTIA